MHLKFVRAILSYQNNEKHRAKKCPARPKVKRQPAIPIIAVKVPAQARGCASNNGWDQIPGQEGRNCVLLVVVEHNHEEIVKVQPLNKHPHEGRDEKVVQRNGDNLAWRQVRILGNPEDEQKLRHSEGDAQVDKDVFGGCTYGLEV